MTPRTDDTAMRSTRQLGVRHTVPLIALLTFVAGGAAEAQSPAERRVVVGTSGGVQFVKDAFMNNVAFKLFQEAGKFDANYNITTNTALDGGVAVRLWKGLAAGVVVSHFYNLTTAAIEAEVPHPFFFEFPRTTTGLAGGLTRREVGVHLQAQYWYAMTDWLLVRGFFGPTFFNVSHDLVSTIETAERGFPFQEVDLIGHQTTKVGESAVGFNIGLDASFFGLRRLGFLGDAALLDHVGLAFVLRYSRATAPAELNGVTQPSIELGGTHVAGGLRVAF